MKVLGLLLLTSTALAAPTTNLFPKTEKEWTKASLINPEELGGYFEGDIELPLPLRGKNGLLDEKYRWPNGVVAYEFDSGYSESQKEQVRNGMDNYENMTGGCISFVERTTEVDYIDFTQDDDDGCHSMIGRRGGRQNINYAQRCLDRYGTVMHEMLHALGFYHEQSRWDRDDYVTIMWENIEDGYAHNFEKYSDSVIGGFGEEYDYGSVMHYSAYAFSNNGEKTIITVDPDAEIGQREDLSEADLNKLMAMYKCV